MKQSARIMLSALLLLSFAPASTAQSSMDDGAAMPPPTPLAPQQTNSNSSATPQFAPPVNNQPVPAYGNYSGSSSYGQPDYGSSGYQQPYNSGYGYGQPYSNSTGYEQPSYVRQFSPYIPPYSPYGGNFYQTRSRYPIAPRIATAPAGMVLPITLQTSISTQVARSGDYVQADITRNLPLQGFSYIPAGSALVGEVVNAEPGRLFGRSGLLRLQFNQLRLPSGQTIPIEAHTLGNIAKYAENNGTMRGEGWGTKIGAFALRSAIGAGAGAVLGTAIGAIASRGRYVGTGAWAGTAIGGGLGVVDDLVLRRGRNVLIHAGTPMQLQLDEPIEIPVHYQEGVG